MNEKIDKEKIEIKPLKPNKKTLEILLKFDEDSQRINFPKDRPNRKETISRIKREYEEEPEGMNLVTYDGEIIGCLFLKTRYNPYRRCNYGDLRNIYLVKEFRGKDIGEILMLYMERYFRKRGCKYILLGTSFNNERARGLYKKMGSTTTRIIMEKKIA